MPPGIPGQFLCLKPNHLQPQRFQIIGACRITGDSAIIIMLTAINFNNQFCTGTVEVRHKGVDDPLLIDFGGICTQKKYQSLRSWGVISRRRDFAFSSFVLSFGIGMAYLLCCGARLAAVPLPLPLGEVPRTGRVFTLSVSFADSSPRVGAKGRPELGQALGHHDRPPSCGRPLASPFGRGAQCAHWAERAICRIRSAETATEAKGSNCGVERKMSKLVIYNDLINLSL